MRNQKLAVLGLFLLTGAVVGIQLMSRPDDLNRPSATAAKRVAPDFVLKDIRGQAQKLSSQKGKLIFVHFWAAWCPPCIEEIPQFVALAKRFENVPGIVFVAVSLDSSWPEASKILLPNDLPARFISLLDTQGKTPEQWGTYQFPESYLVAPDFTIVKKWVGAQDWDSPAIRAILEAALPKS